MRLPRHIMDLVLGCAAAGLLTSMLASALHDVSHAWDVWYYHLPFAARIGGIAGPGVFVLSRVNQARFAGFPLLGECLQALFWRVAGHPEAANLLAFLSVPLFGVFLQRRFGVKLSHSCLGLLAVPLIQIHATACYVDLPANVALSTLILLLIETCVAREPPSGRSLLLAGVVAAIASNMKLVLEPLVLLALLLLALRVLPVLLRAPGDRARQRAHSTVAAALVALPVIFATPLKNTLLHHNPAYPERLQLLGLQLPGIEEPYSSSPVWLAHAPEPLRFAASVLELGLPSLSSHRRWSIDQWTPADQPGYRMGGFFGAYVGFELAVLMFRVARERTRAVRVSGLAFALLTAVISVMPQSHELRYYLCWVIVLVSLNRSLAARASARGPTPRALGVASAVALGAVLWATRCVFAYPSGVRFEELVSREVDAKILATVADGERVCTRRAPFALLWAAPFHPPRRYLLKAAEEPAGCDGYRPLD